jgi:hypothetical protein
MIDKTQEEIDAIMQKMHDNINKVWEVLLVDNTMWMHKNEYDFRMSETGKLSLQKLDPHECSCESCKCNKK